MSGDGDVHRLLSSAAEGAPADREDLATKVITRHLQRRRNRQLTGVAAAAIAVVIAGVPLLTSSDQDTRHQIQTVDQQTVDVLTGQPRGDLAGDPALIAGLLAKDWGQMTPPVESREVVFLGDVGGIRTALVIGEADGRRTGAWFTGPRGAGIEQLTLASPPAPVRGDAPLVRLDTSTSPNALVVISAPGDQVALSPAVTVTTGGRLSRSYRPLQTERGVATAEVGTTTAYGVAASVRIDRAGATVFRGAPAATGVAGPAPAPTQVAVLAGQPQPPAALVGLFDTDLARATGLTPDQLNVRVTWVGTIPGPENTSTPAAVLSATYPSGAVVVASGWAEPVAEPASSSSAQYCSFTFLPAGSSTTPLAARCDVTSGGQEAASTVLLLGPPDATTVQLRDSDGATVSTVTLTAGNAQVSATGRERTAQFATDRRELAPVPLSPWFTGDLGRYGS